MCIILSSHNNRIFGFIAPAQDQDISSKQQRLYIFASHNLTNAAQHRFALEGQYFPTIKGRDTLVEPT